jgi:hypothetical protein
MTVLILIYPVDDTKADRQDSRRSRNQIYTIVPYIRTRSVYSTRLLQFLDLSSANTISNVAPASSPAISRDLYGLGEGRLYIRALQSNESCNGISYQLYQL